MLNRCSLFIYFKMLHFKSLLNFFFTILLLFCVWLSGQGGMRDLSPLTKDWNHTTCIRRRSLNHWTTREVTSISALQELYLSCASIGLIYQIWAHDCRYSYWIFSWFNYIYCYKSREGTPHSSTLSLKNPAGLRSLVDSGPLGR